jgi:hypothetical protein
MEPQEPTTIFGVILAIVGLVLSPPVLNAILSKKSNKEVQEKLDKIVTRVDSNDLKINTVVEKLDVTEKKLQANDEKLENSRASLEEYKIAQAILALSQANWNILNNESGSIDYSTQEQHGMLIDNLKVLQDSSKWSFELRRGVNKVYSIMDKQGVKHGTME